MSAGTGVVAVVIDNAGGGRGGRGRATVWVCGYMLALGVLLPSLPEWSWVVSIICIFVLVLTTKQK